MIKAKEDLREYLKADQVALGKEGQRSPRFKHDIVWTYQILLRKCEYYENCRKDLVGKIWAKWLKFRLITLSHKLGFSIGLNVFDKGLSIAHYGPIVVSAQSRIGKNCRIHEGVTIGVTGDAYWKDIPRQAATIGDNVFIGSGAKIIGPVSIADNVAIGANAVVVKDITEPNTTWGGVPAKKISSNGSSLYIKHEQN